MNKTFINFIMLIGLGASSVIGMETDYFNFKKVPSKEQVNICNDPSHQRTFTKGAAIENFTFLSPEVETFLKPYKLLPIPEVTEATVDTLKDLGFYSAERLYELFLSHLKTDKDKSYQYLHQSAAQGYAPALIKLSRSYNSGRGLYKQNLYLSRLLCQEAANLGHPEATFTLQVSAYTEGYFDEAELNHTQGIKNALTLEQQGNERAKKFLDSLRNQSIESIYEVKGDDMNEADIKFLAEFKGFKGE